MKKITILAVIAFAATAILATNPSGDPKETAKQAVGDLMKTMMGVLMQTMSAEGPAEAIGVCADTAYIIKADIEERYGVKIKRTTLKPRNPNNAPNAYEKEVLEMYAEEIEAGTMEKDEIFYERVMEDGELTFKYFRPMSMMGACLTCHGDAEAVPEDVAAKIAERYPEDQAMGYHEGEFRGAIVITVPIEGDAPTEGE